MIEKRLVINKTPSETRIAVLENGRLAELFTERSWEKSILGNIYKGTVLRVLPGMNAAFVDIGMEKSAFLFGGDTYSPDMQLRPRHINNSGEREEEDEEEAVPLIHEVVREGQEIIVQISKEPLSTKGPRITMHPTIAGRHLVMMPYTNMTALSRKIENESEKKRLTLITEKLIENDSSGIIVRTAAQGVPKESLVRDYNILKKVWSSIQEKISHNKSPSLIYSELDLVKKTIRDFFDDSLKSITIDDYYTFQSIRSFISENIPEAFKFLSYYNDTKPIFDVYGIEIDLGRAIGKRIDLPSGGYLIIEQTEALATFDVNTGKFVGKANARQTILKTNLEASSKIVEQLRLRNMGGIIIIDFIDMEEEEDREKVYNLFKEDLQQDRALTNILKLSEFGLIQMTRKRTSDSLERKLLTSCPHCDGRGSVRTVQTEALDILREIIRIHHQTGCKSVRVRVRPDIKEWINTHEKSYLRKICSDLNISVDLIPSQLTMRILRELPYEVEIN